MGLVAAPDYNLPQWLGGLEVARAHSERTSFRFSLTLKKLDVQPFLLEEVTVIITTASSDRPDEIGNLLPCLVKLKNGEAHTTQCKEPTGWL